MPSISLNDFAGHTLLILRFLLRYNQNKMASSGSPLLRHLFNSLVKRVAEVKKEEKEYNENTTRDQRGINESSTRDRSYSVTSTDSGYCEGSSLQGENCLKNLLTLFPP